MSRAVIPTGQNEYIMATANHASGEQIFNNVPLSGKLPDGFAIKELYLRGLLDITIDPFGGVAMTSADEACQAIAQFTFNNIKNVLKYENVSGDDLCMIARALSPRGKSLYDFAPNSQTPLANGITYTVEIMIPVWFPNAFLPGFDSGERLPAELFRKASLWIQTANDAAWVTLGPTGTVTGTWDLIASCFPARRMILPCPLEIWKGTVNAGVEYAMEQATAYHQLLLKTSLAAPFTLTDRDVLKIGNNAFWPVDPRPYLLRDIQRDQFSRVEDIIVTSDLSRYRTDRILALVDGREEIGDSPLYKAGPNMGVTYQPQSNTNLLSRRYLWWGPAHLGYYSELLGFPVTGGQHVGPLKGMVTQGFTPNLVLPLDISDFR